MGVEDDSCIRGRMVVYYVYRKRAMSPTTKDEHHAQAHHHHRLDNCLGFRWLLLQCQEFHGQEHPSQAHPCAL